MTKNAIKILTTLLVAFAIITTTFGCISGQEEQSEINTTNLTMIQGSYAVVDTGQYTCYDNSEEISYPEPGELFYGQDAQYNGNQPSYQDNGDGTITDLNIGLMWQQTPAKTGLSWYEAEEYCATLELGEYDDWRMPTTKEMFSISDFSQGWPYLDTTYFDIAGNSVSKDEQYWTEPYVGTTVEGGSDAAFGINHGTGHIKAYAAFVSGPMGNYVRAVRGESYGVNAFVDNGDGTVTDEATGLMWQQADSGMGLDWENALSYAENLELAGYDDWRLPNVKELQSIVDYTKSPSAYDDADLGPAIDTDFFDITELPEGTTKTDPDYGYFWTSTSAYFGPQAPDYYYAWYVAFGTAVNSEGADFHGAGGVRFDTKVEGDPFGEDEPRVYNYVRLVRGGLSNNQAPDKPEIPDGPTSGETGTEYTYTTSTNDPEEEQLYYWFDWGDDSNSGWLGPYDSGDVVSASHVWDSRGSYEIRVKTKDESGAQSEWSNPLPVSMPKSKSTISQLFRFIEEHPVISLASGGISIVLLFTIWKILHDKNQERENEKENS